MEDTLARRPRYRDLDHFKVQFKPLPLCTSILITNLSEKTTEDGIILKLESSSIGEPDCVKNVEFKENDKYAIVHFEVPEGMTNFHFFSLWWSSRHFKNEKM